VGVAAAARRREEARAGDGWGWGFGSSRDPFSYDSTADRVGSCKGSMPLENIFIKPLVIFSISKFYGISLATVASSRKKKLLLPVD
jgi:hypothetical protein